jgi:hypothetical protein
MIEREAHYTQGKQPTVQLASTYNHRRLWGRIIKVSGKREARQVAKRYDATPWNF